MTAALCCLDNQITQQVTHQEEVCMEFAQGGEVTETGAPQRLTWQHGEGHTCQCRPWDWLGNLEASRVHGILGPEI